MNIDLDITPIAAFSDNYIWVIHNQRHAVVIDPGDGNAVIAFLNKFKLSPVAILITHHHHDHTDGNELLVNTFHIPVYGPAREAIPSLNHALQAPDTIMIDELDLTFRILDVPGHTAGHIAYYSTSMLFCGDTLFGCGCGRLFEGTPLQMLTSLTQLGQLPEDTRVYCAHEYTLGNIAFALTLEPDNIALHHRAEVDQTRIRSGQPTLPSTIGMELATNPFLRCHLPPLKQAAERIAHHPLTDPIEVFSQLRASKNIFRVN